MFSTQNTFHIITFFVQKMNIFWKFYIQNNKIEVKKKPKHQITWIRSLCQKYKRFLFFIEYFIVRRVLKIK